MATRKPDLSLQASPEVELAIASFKPRWGNTADIRITKIYGEIKKTLTFIKNNREKRDALKTAITYKKNKAKKLKDMEEHLLWLLKQR